jgi:hypothetical protein
MDLSAYPKPSAVAATINTSPVTETITREGLFPPFQFAISVKKKKTPQTLIGLFLEISAHPLRSCDILYPPALACFILL